MPSTSTPAGWTVVDAELMARVSLTLQEIEDISRRVFSSNGCDEANVEALVRTVVTAERDGSLSHGLFRVPGYVASLRSGKVNGRADPSVVRKTPGDEVADEQFDRVVLDVILDRQDQRQRLGVRIATPA